jgi:hypothetical protein
VRPPESQECQRCASAFIQEQCTSSRDCPTFFRLSTSRGFPVFFISRLTPPQPGLVDWRFLPICSGAFYPFLCCRRIVESEDWLLLVLACVCAGWWCDCVTGSGRLYRPHTLSWAWQRCQSLAASSRRRTGRRTGRGTGTCRSPCAGRVPCDPSRLPICFPNAHLHQPARGREGTH